MTNHNKNSILADEDGKVYRCENHPYVSHANVELVASGAKALCGMIAKKLWSAPFHK